MVRRGVITLLTLAMLVCIALRSIACNPTSALIPYSVHHCDPVFLDFNWTQRIQAVPTIQPHAFEAINESRLFTLGDSSGRSLWIIPAGPDLLVFLTLPRAPGVVNKNHQLAFKSFHVSAQDLPGSLTWISQNCNFQPGFTPPAYALRAWGVGMPIWTLIILFGFYPVLAFLRGPMRRLNWRSRGWCIYCGYDLAGIAERRCPECASAFCPLRRASAMARRRSRFRKILEWPALYRGNHPRKNAARAALCLTLILLALWTISYLRISVRTPWSYTRLAWGLIAVFVEPDSPRSGPKWDVTVYGYQGMGTIWWTRPLNVKERHAHLPVWLFTAISATVWFAIYRPHWHWRARHSASVREFVDLPDSCLLVSKPADAALPADSRQLDSPESE